MKKETILKWLKEEGEQISASIKIMCHMYIKDASYTFRISSALGGGSYCSVHNHDILIHVGIPEWFDSDCQGREIMVKVLGHEPNLQDMQAYYKGLAMHEFMHACITRPGNIIDQIAMKFPMRNKGATKYQQDFYKINIKKTIHHWFNCVCDARIETVGKNRFNVSQYFDFMRLLDYMAATKSSGSDAWDFGYALLQLGVIGRLPQYPIPADMNEAIEAITKSEVKGSSKTKDLLDEFVCEPHETISARKFAKWFDIPKVHDYVAKLLYDEVESFSKEAEALAQMLANMPNEVRLSGNSAQSPLPLELPVNISSQKPLQGDQQESGDSDQSQQNQSSSQGSDESEEHAQNNEGSADKSSSNNQKDSDEQTSGAGKGNEMDESEETTDSENNIGSDDENESESVETNSPTSSESENEKSRDEDEDNDESSLSKQDESEKEDNNQVDQPNEGDPNECDSQDQQQGENTSEPIGGDFEGSESEKSSESQKTFDENGDWARADQGGKKAKKTADLTKDNVKIREALNKAIDEIKKTTTPTRKKVDTPQKAGKGKAQYVSHAEVVINKSFKADMLAPNAVVKAAKPLRAVLKRAFCEDQEDDIVGLKAGSLNTKALYRLHQSDLSIFKEHRLPTINSAVYYILWDGSGSMCGFKQSESGSACAVIEEAVRGVYPLKIVNFCTEYSGVIHYVVRDFDSKDKKNAAYSFAAKRIFNGGNKDGFSIREAAKELICRSETNKFLIVLSDGAPSDYDSRKHAIEDVQGAVAFAREHNINVTSIFFGSELERDRQIDLYKEMYGKSHIVSCEPSAIVSHLIAIVKKNIHKH